MERRLTVETERGATGNLPALEATPGSPLPESVESVATRLDPVHLRSLPREPGRWIARGVDHQARGETAFDRALTGMGAGRFAPAGVRRPQWTAASPRHRPMPVDSPDPSQAGTGRVGQGRMDRTLTPPMKPRHRR